MFHNKCIFNDYRAETPIDLTRTWNVDSLLVEISIERRNIAGVALPIEVAVLRLEFQTTQRFQECTKAQWSSRNCAVVGRLLRWDRGRILRYGSRALLRVQLALRESLTW
jgi:hypothetical protein